MLQRILTHITLAVALGATSAAALAEAKMAYVNVARVMQESPQIEGADDRLKQEFGTRTDKLKAEEDEIKRLEDDFVVNNPTMSPEQRARTEKDLTTRKRDLVRRRDDLREEVNLRRNEELGKLQQAVRETVEAIGKAENYDIIFLDMVVAYAAPRLDITDKVLLRLRDKSKESAAKGKDKK